MIILTDEETDHMAELVLGKLSRDKKFDKYTSTEIVTILSCCIMQIGMDIGIAIQEEVENEQRAS